VTDRDGVRVWEVDSDVFGARRTEGSVGGQRFRQPWGFPGQYLDDETGLWYNRFRYYDAAAGVYTGPDPIGVEGGLNPFTYVPSTWNWTDVTGLSSDDTIRVRHYTRTSSINKISNDMVIKASDQNRVFTVKANDKVTKKSARELETALGIKFGKGNAFIEFDAKLGEVEKRFNPKTGATEYVLKGDVDLKGKNATFSCK